MTLPPIEFWDEEERRLWEELAPLFLSIVTIGGKSGHDLLPEAMRLLIDWDVFNSDAIAYLKKQRLSWVNNISETTRTQAIEAITDWIEAGDPLPLLEKRLALIFPDSRAHQIAVTETTRAYAEGNQLAWKATGIVSGKRWMTANDELVCPLCGPLHNQFVELDDIFIQTPTDIASSPQMQALYGEAYDKALRRAESLLRSSGAYIGGPPRHPNCRCWLQPIVAEDIFRAKLRKAFGYFGDDEIQQLIDDLKAWEPRVEIIRY